MKISITLAMREHLAGGTTTLARCWKCRRKDGVVFGFTNTDVPMVIDGVRYEASTGFTPSALQGKADLSVQNMEVSGMLDSASITERDLMAGRWDGCEVEIFDVNFRDLSMGRIPQIKGKTGEVRAGRTQFSTEVRGLKQQLQQTVGQLYSPTCRADYGDPFCKVDLGTVTVQGAITSVSDKRVFADSSRGEGDNYFRAGKITFHTGLNAGLSMEVKAFSGGQFELYLGMPYDISIGDEYEAYPGCLKRLQDCKDKNNIINFRGEPDVPGNDQMLKVGGT